MTFRELHAAMLQFIADHPDHEALDQRVVVRVDAADDAGLQVGGLTSATVDAGCTDTFALVLDADQQPDQVTDEDP